MYKLTIWVFGMHNSMSATCTHTCYLIITWIDYACMVYNNKSSLVSKFLEGKPFAILWKTIDKTSQKQQTKHSHLIIYKLKSRNLACDNEIMWI